LLAALNHRDIDYNVDEEELVEPIMVVNDTAESRSANEQLAKEDIEFCISSVKSILTRTHRKLLANLGKNEAEVSHLQLSSYSYFVFNMLD